MPYLRDEEAIELLSDEAQCRIVERYTEEAIGFIRAGKDRPFFLYLPRTAVYVPIYPGPSFAGRSANGRFGDWVEEASWRTSGDNSRQLARWAEAFQATGTETFPHVDKERIIAYLKRFPDSSEIVLAVVNLDPHNVQSGWLDLPLEDLEIDPLQSYEVHDLFGDARYSGNGDRNYVELDPWFMPAHVFKLRRCVRTERDFDNYL